MRVCVGLMWKPDALWSDSTHACDARMHARTHAGTPGTIASDENAKAFPAAAQQHTPPNASNVHKHALSHTRMHALGVGGSGGGAAAASGCGIGGGSGGGGDGGGDVVQLQKLDDIRVT